MPAPPSNRLRVGDPYRPSLQASFDGRMRCHYGITARRATRVLGGWPSGATHAIGQRSRSE